MRRKRKKFDSAAGALSDLINEYREAFSVIVYLVILMKKSKSGLFVCEGVAVEVIEKASKELQVLDVPGGHHLTLLKLVVGGDSS